VFPEFLSMQITFQSWTELSAWESITEDACFNAMNVRTAHSGCNEEFIIPDNRA
jgi:hypothetical protein